MRKLFRLLGRKLRFVLPVALVCLLVAAGSAFAQSATLTATVRVNPLQVKVIAPGVVTVGEWFDISAKISNQGSDTVSKTTALMNTPSELKVRGKRKRIGNLAPGATETVIWRARANQAGSNLVIQVNAQGFLDGEKISVSSSTIISATGSLGAFLLRLIFGV